MSLSLVVGPAHAGKVGKLLERFLAALDRDPWLIVPQRADVEHVERELLEGVGGLLAGTIGTFDTLFDSLARSGGGGKRLLGESERTVLIRRISGAASASGARPAGFADAVGRALAELDSALLEPDDLADPLASLARAYRAELDRLDAWDRGMVRRRAVDRLTGDVDAWGTSPVFAYGFEDLTGAEWRLLEALSARAEVHVSIPYEPGRPVYSSLMRTVDDLASVAAGSVVELPPRGAEFLPASLAHVERQLFAGDPVVAPLDGSIRWLEGAGSRGTLELVAEGALAEIRAGTPPHEIAVVCPSVEAVRLALGTAFASLGVPVSFESRAALATTPFGYALLSLLRFAWVGGDRRGLFASLRSPYSGLARKEVDWIEGRLRGRGIVRGDRAAEVATELREGRSLPPLDNALRDSSPVAVARELAATMLRSAHGTSEPPTGERSRLDLRVYDAVSRALDELDMLTGFGAVTRQRCSPRSIESPCEESP